MADSKTSALTDATTVAGADEIYLSQSGTDRALSITKLRGGTTPTIISVGASFTGTGAPTATLPGTHAANDILLLILQSENQADHAPPTNYARIGPSNGIGAAGTAGSTKLHVFWKRDGGAEGAPTILDTGDHTMGIMLAIRGCPTTGDPFRYLGDNWKFTASTTGTGPATVTTQPNCLHMTIFAHAVDSGSAQGSSAANASLTSVTEDADASSADGDGGGVAVITGIKADPGAVVASTITWGSSSVDVSMALAWIPVDAPTYERCEEIQMFIGSPADLDDVWTKPAGARKVFVQTMDGGGSGSGGRSSATAAGGGGGGGGGYDEAWFNASDLAATISVHAGKGGASSAVDAAGNPGVISEFDKGGASPLTSTRRIAGTAATATISADGGNGGCGSGRGTVSMTVNTTRADLTTIPAANIRPAVGAGGGSGGSGTTAPTGGSPGDWGGGGGESGADTDASTTSANNGYSLRGGGGGGGGRTNTNIGGGGMGGGAAAPAATQGQVGVTSGRFPYGGSGGCGGGSAVPAGGNGGFPGGGGGGGGGVATGTGGVGGMGMVVVTTFF